MKRVLFIFLCLYSGALLYGQTSNFRFGRISDDEVGLTVYENDPTAPAAVLYENTSIYYTFDLAQGDIRRVTEYTVRIKVFTADGTSWGDVEIPFYDSPYRKERISGLNANSYNLENGKVVKNALKRQYIYNEQLSEYGRQMKFSIPEVRPGSVIEYQYTMNSDLITVIPAIDIQRDIPVAYSKMSAAIPEYFKFNQQVKGYHHIPLERETASRTVNDARVGTLMYTEHIISSEVRDIPALKEAPMVWCIDDFRSKITFEFSGFDMPGLYKPVAQSWENVNKLLAEDPDFGRGMRMNNPFKEEVKAIADQCPESLDRIRAIHKLVMSKVSWNEYYSLYPDKRRQVIREGNGNSADINFILMSALRDAGFETVPILLNPRNFGRLPQFQPTLDRINTFVVAVRGPGIEEVLVLDGTSRYSDVNMLPTPLLVDQARIYGLNGADAWMNLTRLARNTTQHVMMANVGEDGMLQGTITRTYSNQPALDMKRRYHRSSSEEEYIESIEENNTLTVQEYKISGLEDPYVIEEYGFRKELSRVGDRIYINATGIPFMSKSMLTEQERVLPVEYNYPETIVTTFMVDIPDGYEVEELPERISYAACNDALRLNFLTQQAGSRISVKVTLQIARAIFSSVEYSDLKTFFDMVVAQSGSQIVLKKT